MRDTSGYDRGNNNQGFLMSCLTMPQFVKSVHVLLRRLPEAPRLTYGYDPMKRRNRPSKWMNRLDEGMAEKLLLLSGHSRSYTLALIDYSFMTMIHVNSKFHHHHHHHHHGENGSRPYRCSILPTFRDITNSVFWTATFPYHTPIMTKICGVPFGVDLWC